MTATSQRKKIAILGYGLTGRLAALKLYQQHQVSVFESGKVSGEQSAGFVAAADASSGWSVIVIVGYTVSVAILESYGSLFPLPVDLAVPTVTAEPTGCEYAEGM